jgi:6,7-dimethyl-8-ribityllumazine synthase
MRTLQFAGVAVVFGILTYQTIRDIIKDMKEKSEYGYDSRRHPSTLDNDV